jgi:hypothetical protein
MVETGEGTTVQYTMRDFDAVYAGDRRDFLGIRVEPDTAEIYQEASS